MFPVNSCFNLRPGRGTVSYSREQTVTDVTSEEVQYCGPGDVSLLVERRELVLRSALDYQYRDKLV